MSSAIVAAVLEGVRHVVRRPFRSALTALTSAVAIAVTVNVISLNYGLDEDIRKDLARFGRTTIDVGRSPLIRPGAARAQFGEEAVAEIRSAVAGTDALVVPIRQLRVTWTGTVEVSDLSLVATGIEFPRTTAIPLEAGRWFTERENGLSACVLDDAAARALFPGLLPDAIVGKAVRTDRGRDPLPVVGVLGDPMTYRSLFEAFDEGRGSRTVTASLLSFRNVYVPEDALGRGDLSLVEVVLPDLARVHEAAKRLRERWPGDVKAFDAEKSPLITVFVRDEWIEAMGGATQMGASIGNIVWILIVLVACILLSTLYLVSIRERYDEIAVRRCEGARKRDVAVQVMTESVVTSFAGGCIGLPLGYLLSALLRTIVDIPFRFDPRYAGVAVSIAIVLGLVSSVVPARRTASLDPAQVLTRRLS
jgi:putative ABC transport system permease protein